MATDDVAPYRIGEVADRLGVSTRTLRYYQELGLLDPAGQSEGGNRRYSEDDVTRAMRILELRNVMGFELERIGEILSSEDRLAEIRAEAKRGVSVTRKREIAAEAIAITEHVREQVADKMAVLADFDADLEARLARLHIFVAELAEAADGEVSGEQAAARA
ncbi:MAG TPA: MerR family transcriptional regulator [Acidimicrobiales bacterium]|nr:MerR family transcriptional regulator [Acidimicrobiales bacterium]